MLALIVGPLQSLAWVRTRHLTVHRWLGRIYVFSVVVGSIAGFYMAWLSYGGLPTHVAFASLAVWWCTTALVAYRHVVARRVEAHRRWMIRSYAMTFAAVTLRLWLLLLIFPLQVAFDEAYATVAWICWVWNIPVAEWLVRRRAGVQQRAARPAAAQRGLATA
jgi:uncharacterized membrane protein